MKRDNVSRKSSARLNPTWGYGCKSADLPIGHILAKKIDGCDIVLFRTKSGKVGAVSPICCHMGADLTNGKVTGECIQCPFHNWEFAPNGACVRIPASSKIPEFARLKSYPVVERHGLIFVFSDEKVMFDLPFFDGCDPSKFRAAAPITFEGDFPWYFPSANAFDMQHLECVHERKTLSPPKIDYPHKHSCRVVQRYRITGTDWLDRLLVALYGKEVELSFTSWGGRLMLAVSKFSKKSNYMMFFVEQKGPRCCIIQMIVYAPRPALDLRLARFLSKNFFTHEIRKLHGGHFNPNSLIEADAPMAEYMQWLGF